MTHKASFKQSWARGHRCIIPAESPKLIPDQQGKRSVIPIESCDIDQWQIGSLADAHELLKLAPAGVFDTGPAQ